MEEKSRPQIKELLDGVDSALNTVFDGVRSESIDQTTVKTLLAYIKNIIQRGNDEKYRTIHKTNAAFQQRIGRYPASVDVLRAVGFEERENSFVMPATDIHLRLKILQYAGRVATSFLANQNNLLEFEATQKSAESGSATGKPAFDFNQMMAAEKKKALTKRRMGKMSESEHEDRAIGMLLAGVCADILAAPFDGWSGQAVESKHPGGVWVYEQSTREDLPRERGRYTENTQVLLAISQSIIECSELVPKAVASHCTERYSTDRLYSSCKLVYELLKSGKANYLQSARTALPSEFNDASALIRVAPVAFTFQRSGDRILYEAVCGVLLTTHVNPEAVDGAFVYCKALAEILLLEDRTKIDVSKWVKEMAHTAKTKGLRSKLLKLIALIDKFQSGDNKGISDQKFLRFISSDEKNQATEMTVCALWFFIRYITDPVEAISKVIQAGGRTSTLATAVAMLFGAFYGAGFIPRIWTEQMERDAFDETVMVAKQLSTKDFIGFCLSVEEQKAQRNL